MSATLHSPSPTERDRQPAGPKISAALLWFGVLGGTVSWAVHEMLAWSALEITCQRQEIGSGTYLYIGLVTGIPFLVTLAALTATFVMRARLSGVRADELTFGRTHLMVVVGTVLNLLALAAIVGDGIAIAVLEPC